MPAWTAASLALPTADEKNRTKNTADKSIIFVFFLIIYSEMSYHRYVLRAPPNYTQNFSVFPPNQCVFITYEENAPLFRGGFTVPTLAGTQDHNFVDDAKLQEIYTALPSYDTVDLIRSGTKDLLVANELAEKLRESEKDAAFKIADAILGKSRAEIFPYALKRKIKFAGVSSFNKRFPVEIDGLTEVECMVQGVATIFPRPTEDKIPVCERFVPGDVYKAHIPVYNAFDQIEKIPIGRILDFPNPHSMRVVIDISAQTYPEED